MNLSGYTLVCDYNIADIVKADTDKNISGEIKKADKKAKADKELSDKIKAADDKKYNDEVNDMLDTAMPTGNKASKKDNNSKSSTPFNNLILESDVSARYGKVGRILKSAFLLGPSDAVKSKGKIYVEIDGIPDEDEKADDQHLSDDIDKADKGSKKNKSSKDNEGLIKHNYSIFESCSLLNNYIKYKTKYEAGSVNDNTSDEQSSMQFTDTFISGGEFIVRVVLDKEGFSEWKLLVNADVSAKHYNAIKTALKSGEFKKAYNIAGNFTDTDGLVPISCKTYIYKKPRVHVPWLGYCRYGFAAGTKDNDPAVANTLYLAVAPFDASKGGKPDAKGSSNDKIVFKTAYNITGDISDGKLGALVNFFKDRAMQAVDRITGDRDYDSNEADDEITKYLKSRFKCTGDSSMFEQFNQIRDYIETKLKEEDKESNNKKLEIDINASTVMIEYTNAIKQSKALILY